MTTALVFPGQGSQFAGMGAPWQGRPSWDLVGHISELAGRDVAALLLTADMPTLRQTDNAQLATLALELLIITELEQAGVRWSACAGHSLGEYSALVAAGVLAVPDAVALVTARGTAMARAAHERPGTMCVLLGPPRAADEVVAAVQAVGHEVWPAAYNAPAQVTLSGTVAGIAAAAGHAASAGLRTEPIPVGGAFHSPLMASAGPDLRQAWAWVGTGPGRCPVVANVDGRPHDGTDGWADLAVRQLLAPVRWTESLAALAGPLGCDVIVEAGPGTVLSGLSRKTCPGMRRAHAGTPGQLAALAR
jgi:[acyl-carrier-protein] S-malonyltransferase